MNAKFITFLAILSVSNYVFATDPPANPPVPPPKVELTLDKGGLGPKVVVPVTPNTSIDVSTTTWPYGKVGPTDFTTPTTSVGVTIKY
jgi:hypothetical protein